MTLILKVYPVGYGMPTTARHPLHLHSHTKAESAAAAATAGSLQDLARDADDARPPVALRFLFVC